VYGSGHITAFKDFARAIIDDREPFVNGEEGKKSVEIILGIYKSAREGMPVRFD
jgi:predicted dehydrogenase